MKNTLYAVAAACIAMLATSGIVVLATARPPAKTADAALARAEQQLAMELDAAIGRHLTEIKNRVQRRP
jgi:hypothetical protein